MKPDRAHIDLSFPHPVLGVYFPVKVHLEYAVGPNDTEQEALDAGKKSAEEWFASRYPPLDLGNQPSPITERPFAYRQEQTPVISKDRQPESDRIAALIADINSCTEVKVLESYRIMAKADAKLQTAYDNRLKELTA